MDESPSKPSHDGTVMAIDWRKEIDRHSRWLRTVIAARCGEPQAIDEVFQETAAAAVAQKAPLSDVTKIAPWLYQIAVKQSLMYRRKAGRKRKLEKNYAERAEAGTVNRQPENPLSWVLAKERQELVRQAVDALPPRDAEILLLKYTENWSYRQIADHLGISESAVESRLHRARQKLRKELTRRELD